MKRRGFFGRAFAWFAGPALAAAAGWDAERVSVSQEKHAPVEPWKDRYEGACKTIAEMHAAAVGSIRGPIRGVVEDVKDLRDRYDHLREVSASGGLIPIDEWRVPEGFHADLDAIDEVLSA